MAGTCTRTDGGGVVAEIKGRGACLLTEWDLRDAVQDLLDHGVDIRDKLDYLSDEERAEFAKMEARPASGNPFPDGKLGELITECHEAGKEFLERQRIKT